MPPAAPSLVEDEDKDKSGGIGRCRSPVDAGRSMTNRARAKSAGARGAPWGGDEEPPVEPPRGDMGALATGERVAFNARGTGFTCTSAFARLGSEASELPERDGGEALREEAPGEPIREEAPGEPFRMAGGGEPGDRRRSAPAG